MATVGGIGIDIGMETGAFIADTAKATRAVGTMQARINKKLMGAEKAFHRVNRSVGAITRSAAGLGAAIGGGMLLRGIVQTSAEFQRLGAVLETVEGSSDKAKATFDKLNDFAARTPFDLQQVTEAYTKLKALGIEPTMARMEAFGNVASAMGKDVMQFAEAVADAATGEFERLKEFGIKASKEGDRVKFTFQGITTEVANTGDAITNYLQSIGQTNFAGAMDRQAKTLGGALSNMQQQFSVFAARIGEGGLSAAIQRVALSLSDLGGQSAGAAQAIGAYLGRIIDLFANMARRGAEFVAWVGEMAAPFMDSLRQMGVPVEEIGRIFGDVFGVGGIMAVAVAAISPIIAGLAIAGGPILAVAAAVTAVVVAVQRWDEIVAMVQRVYQAVESYLGAGLTEILATLVGGPFVITVQAATKLYEAFMSWREIPAVAQQVYEGVKTWLVDKLTAAIEMLGGPIGWIQGAFEKLGKVLVFQSIVPDMVDAIGAEFQRLEAVMVHPTRTATAGVQHTFGDIRSALPAEWRSTFDTITGIFDTFASNNLSSIEGWAKSIFDIFGQVSGMLGGGSGGGFSIPGLGGGLGGSGMSVGGFGGGTFDFSGGSGGLGGGGFDFGSVLGFAAGGRPPVGMPSIVGERGPEMFIPDRAGTVISNDALSAMGGSGSIDKIDINVIVDARNSVATQEIVEIAAERGAARGMQRVLESRRRGGAAYSAFRGA